MAKHVEAEAQWEAGWVILSQSEPNKTQMSANEQKWKLCLWLSVNSTHHDFEI
jgi:hypothetical protein